MMAYLRRDNKYVDQLCVGCVQVTLLIVSVFYIFREKRKMKFEQILCPQIPKYVLLQDGDDHHNWQ